MEETPIDGLVAHCQSGRFTGILRMRAREGIGEIWFLSGISDEVSFGVSAGDDAMERMRKATGATYELVARLPHPGGGFKRRFPSKGSIATATPVTLMRYCERYSLTCTLAVENSGVLVEATYKLGELIAVETTADDDGITTMLEAHEGTYEFTLPRVELPAGTPVLPPAPSLAESLPPPESLGFRALLETHAPIIGRPASNEAEVKRKTVEIARQQKATPTSKRPAPIPRPVSKPEPPAEPKKEPAKEPEKAPEKEKPVEPVAVAAPVALEAEPAKAPEKHEEEKSEEEKPREEEAAKDEDEPAAIEEPAKAPPPAKRSLTWLVVPILFAVAIVYLLWTNRM
jgi:hypothetical protein